MKNQISINGMKLIYHILPTDDAIILGSILRPSTKLDVKDELKLATEKRHFKETYYASGWRNHHLYLTSDAPIKDENWYYFNNPKTNTVYISKASKNFREDKQYCKKIEFTTDPKLIADGVPAIDGNTKAWIRFVDFDDFKFPIVNFLEEFCKRYNQKDNQKVDVEKLASERFPFDESKDNSDYAITCGKLQAGFIIGYNQAIQSQAGCFSLEDMRTAMNRVANKINRKLERDNKKKVEVDNFISEYLRSISFTKETPKGDIVIECEMENKIALDGHTIIGSEIKLNKDGQPIFYFK